MNTLITRNIGFGLLMTLVLAFSLLGNSADALTFSTSRSGDLETKAPNEKFTVRFSVSLKGNTAIKDSDGELITQSWTSSDTPAPPSTGLTGPSGLSNQYYVDSSGYLLNKKDGYRVNSDGAAIDGSGYLLDANGKRQKYDHDSDPSTPDVDQRADADKRDQVKVPDKFRYHYNEEAITVTLTGNARIVKIGSRTVDIAPGAFTMYESTHGMYNSVADEYKLSGSVALDLEPTGENGGVVTVKVEDSTAAGDFPTGGTSNPITFTLYSVKYQSDITTTTNVTTLVGDGVDFAYDNDHRPLSDYFTFANDAQVPVHYSIEGSGSLFIRKVYDDNPRSPTSVKTASKTLSTSSSAPVLIDMKRGTNKVTGWVSGGTPRRMIFIYQGTTPAKYPKIERTQGNNQLGVTGGRLEDYLEVKVTDGNGRAVPGVAVKFDDTTAGANALFVPVPDTKVYGTNTTLQTALSAPDQDDLVDSTKDITTAKATGPQPATTIFVQTDSNGVAKTYYQLSDADVDAVTKTLVQTVTASVEGIIIPSVNFTATGTADSRTASLVILSGDSQSGTKGKNLENPLVVIARSTAGYRIPNVVIQFRSVTGTFTPSIGTLQPLENGRSGDPDGNILHPGEVPQHTPNPYSGQQIYVITDSSGQASVEYNIGQTVVARDVIAEVRFEAAITQYDFAVDRVMFKINGGGSTTPPATTQPTQPTTVTPSLTIATTGEGATRSVTVTARDAQNAVVPGLGVTLSGTALTASQIVITGTATTITLPTTPGTYTLTAAASGYTSGTANVTVAAPPAAPQPGTISLALVGAQANGQQAIRVTVRSAAGAAPSGTVNVALTGAGVSRTVATTNGTGTAAIALPATSDTLTASADGYTSGTLTLPARTTTPTTTTPTPTTPTTTPTTPTTTPGEPSRISISGLATQNGTVNQQLDLPLSVRVLDATGTGVANARVIFRVRTGQGRLSQRGNGRAIGVETDRSGYARADYTPMSASSTVEANTTGVTQTVTFTITTDGSAPTTPGTGGTTGTTGTPRTEPKILVGAANRPAMVWIDNGMLFGLTGVEATKIAESVNGAAIGNGKVYWTEKTGASAGTINSANLNGTDATKLATIMAVPMGIAVDTAGKKLYWTNSRGRVQSANLDGSGIRNVRQNLSDPTHIALSSTHIYWVESGDTIRRVNMTGTKVVKDVAVGLMAVGGIAVGGGKVYWTEKTGASAGTINGANLDGTQFKTLATIKAVPMGIAVDTAGKKLYWTNSRGRVQSANLNGSSIRNVVDGLGTPSHIAIEGASEVTAAKPTTQPTTPTPTKKDTAAYDVNGDGTVDNTDASEVSAAMGTTTAKYDVNDDGTVNFFDLLLVFDNRDDAAAAAPTIVGMQLSAVQIAVIEEQIDLLIATGDRSPAAMRTLVYLQQLLATARPEKTQLLANYPNPFNPETWIPYELATGTDVRITIYNAQGVVVRVLHLGQQAAGYYTDRERAAYWDGRNALGEQVASGLYFYQLETDTLSSMRKMVILK